MGASQVLQVSWQQAGADGPDTWRGETEKLDLLAICSEFQGFHHFCKLEFHKEGFSQLPLLDIEGQDSWKEIVSVET